MSSLQPEHGGHATFYGDKELEGWVKGLLWTLNGFTAIITILNLIYLRLEFPRVKDLPSKNQLESSMLESTQSMINDYGKMSISAFSELSQSTLDSMSRSRVVRSDTFIERHRGRSQYRGRIQKYFYVVSTIPCFVSFAGHYGAAYPEDASWIFPTMNIAIGIGFLAFIRMMVMSCEGWQEIKKELLLKPDECESLRSRPMYKKCCRKYCCEPVFLKENAYEGLKQRILFCCLILVKPLINYMEAIFEIDYHSSFHDERLVSYTLKTLCFVTTFVPLNLMRSFHGSLLPYTRLRRSGIKRFMIAFLGIFVVSHFIQNVVGFVSGCNLTVFLSVFCYFYQIDTAPVCQIQELVVNFTWGHSDIAGFEGIEDKYRWNCAYGVILVIEMTIVSMVITSWAYRPRDLRLWEYPEHFLRKNGYHDKMKDDEFLFGTSGIIDNLEEHVPADAYIRDNSLVSMDSRLMSDPSFSKSDEDGM